MESAWPHFLLQLLNLTGKGTEGRVAMHARFSILTKAHQDFPVWQRVVKVTGTNGKGSVCAMLEACLGSAGQKVGLFTSPHLFRVTERFRVAGVDVSSDTLDRYAEGVLSTVHDVISEHGETHTPSFFECLLLIALQLFHDENVDVAIFEAGVGGYNDAVSLLAGEFSVITNIGMDHKKQLGDSLEAIAADKAGIASKDAQLILGPDISESLRRIIEERLQGQSVSISQASLDELRPTCSGLDQPTLIDMLVDGRMERYELPLLGRHQVGNFATVVAVLRAMAEHGVVHDLDCLKGVARTRWPGRMEVRSGSPRYVIDAAHNENGIRALTDALADLVPYSERVLLFGTSIDKDYAAYVQDLSRLAPEAFVVEGFHHAQRASVIADLMPGSFNRLQVFQSPRDAVEFFRKSPLYKDRTIVATGSIFLIGELMNLLDCAQS